MDKPCKINMGGTPVVVTGAAGFLGRAVVRRLIKAGYKDILACDLRPKPYDPDFNDVVWLEADLFEWPVAPSLLSCDPVAVYHCAGVMGTTDLEDKPALAVAHNAMATANLLEACAARPAPPHLVYASKPDAWRNVYSATKRCAEELCTIYDKSGRVPSARLRLYNLYGEGQPFGPVRRFVPSAAALGLFDRPVQIFGTGRQTVCLTHVEDAAESMVRAGRVRWRGSSDVGCGSIDVESVARFVADHFKVGVEYKPMRAGEDHYNYIDARPNELLTEQIGKLPDRDWPKGVAAYCEWARSADPTEVKPWSDRWHST